MKIKNFLITCLLLSVLSFGLKTSAVKVFSDECGNEFFTKGRDSITLSIDTNKAALTEAMFNQISAQAKKDGYKHILLSDSVLLDQNAAQRLALNFLTAIWDDYYNACIKLTCGDLFKDGATVKDVKCWIVKQTFENLYPYPFVKPYLILPADELVPDILFDVYVNGDCFDSNGCDNGKYPTCVRYYRICDMHFVD